VRVLSYLISSSLIHRNGFFSPFFLSGFEAPKWFPASLYVSRLLSLFGAEKNTNSFFQNLKTFWGQQYVYKIHTKAQKIKKVSKEIRICQLMGADGFGVSRTHSRFFSKRNSDVANAETLYLLKQCLSSGRLLAGSFETPCFSEVSQLFDSL